MLHLEQTMLKQTKVENKNAKLEYKQAQYKVTADV